MTLLSLTQNLVGFVNALVIPLLYALAILFFLIGMVRFFFAEGDENRTKGRAFMLWGLIGLAVIFSVWGLVRVFLSLFIY
ncbi:MAG: hypothetical protein WAV21_00515 [Minisyncoccia bacterium]